MQNLREKHLTKIDESLSEYNPFEKSRYYNQYIGLKNLSSICYMNSVLQQFFMIPLFRNAILSLPIPKDLDENKEDNDNLLFQLIRMFYYLNYSDKGDYNPKNFVFSFKDYEGNPTRIDIQCDEQEFLSRFIEKVEECLKNDKQQFLCNNILGGTTLQQVKCTNPECGNISERKENINFLSVDIKNVGNIDQCLNKFIKEETIEDYHCEKCNKKITHIKHVLIDIIPNILIIHLQRIAFSYETFNMEKINTHITFEKTLNIKRYTVNKENPEIPSEYYDYDLQGILIHSGTAQYCHYYSIILNTEAYSEYWYKFNDSQVNSVDYNTIISDAYGNSGPYAYGSSAYMLIYQKRTKKPVIIDSKELDENIKKILDEKKEQNLDKIQLDNGNIYYIYETEKDAIEKNVEMKKDDNDIHKLKENKVDKNIIIKNNCIQAKLLSFEEALNL
jgi:ubiquitin C-terminal hydrolase